MDDKLKIQQARDILDTWDLTRAGEDAPYCDRERVLAEQVRALLTILDQPAPAGRTVTYDTADKDTYFVLMTALEDFAVEQADKAAGGDSPAYRTRWAETARALRRQTQAAWHGGTGL